jgi:hypothetical protein
VENKDLVLVTSLHELDGVTADLAPNIPYVGPAFAWPPAPRGWQPLWSAGDPRPLILASLSTMPGQITPAPWHGVVLSLYRVGPGYLSGCLQDSVSRPRWCHAVPLLVRGTVRLVFAGRSSSACSVS